MACGVAPHTDMNPVLLKPNSDTGAQVIVHGRALANMEAGAFHEYKARAMQAVMESFARLGAAYDAILVEGAGSPPRSTCARAISPTWASPRPPTAR